MLLELVFLCNVQYRIKVLVQLDDSFVVTHVVSSLTILHHLEASAMAGLVYTTLLIRYRIVRDALRVQEHETLVVAAWWRGARLIAPRSSLIPKWRFIAQSDGTFVKDLVAAVQLRMQGRTS